jgi:hypothetical protein
MEQKDTPPLIRPRSDYNELRYDLDAPPFLTNDDVMEAFAEIFVRVLDPPEELGLEIRWSPGEIIRNKCYSFKFMNIAGGDWHDCRLGHAELFDRILDYYDDDVHYDGIDDCWNLGENHSIDRIHRAHRVYNRFLDYYKSTYGHSDDQIDWLEIEQNIADQVGKTGQCIVNIGDKAVITSDWERCLITSPRLVIELMLYCFESFFCLKGISEFDHQALTNRDLYRNAGDGNGYHETNYIWESEFITPNIDETAFLPRHQVCLYPGGKAKASTKSYGFVVECVHWQGQAKKFRAYHHTRKIGEVDCASSGEEFECRSAAIQMVLKNEIPLPDALLEYMAKVLVNKSIPHHRRFSLGETKERGQKHRLLKRRGEFINILSWIPDIDSAYNEIFKEDKFIVNKEWTSKERVLKAYVQDYSKSKGKVSTTKSSASDFENKQSKWFEQDVKE